MSQYPIAGVQKHHVGIDLRNTPGLYISQSGGVSGKAVAYQELSTAIASLESAYQTADSSDTAAWSAAYNNLSSQLAALSSGVSANVAVALKYNGTQAALQTALTSSGGNYTVTQGSKTVQIEPSTLTSAKTDFYKHGVLLSESGQPAELFFVNASGALVAATQFDDDLKAGTLIYVDQGDVENTFWQMPDEPVTAGAIEGLIPFGRVQDLKVASESFLTLAANQLNASLNGDYFVVTGGALTLSVAFLTRVTAIETSVSDEVTARAAAVTSLQTALDGEAAARAGAITAEAQTRSDADTALTTNLASEASTRASAVSGLATRATAIEAVNTAQDTEIDLKADQSALDAVVSTQSATDAAQNTKINGLLSNPVVVPVMRRITTLNPTSGDLAGLVTSADGTDPKSWFFLDYPSSYSGVFYATGDSSQPYRQVGTLAGAGVSEIPWVGQHLEAGTLIYVNPSVFGGKGTYYQVDRKLNSDDDAVYSPVIDQSVIEAALAAEVTARTSADTAINTAITDANTTIAAHTVDLANLDAITPWMVSNDQLLQTISDFYADCHPIVLLTDGVFDNSDTANPTTTFRVLLPDVLDWSLGRLSETAAPYQTVSRPAESFTGNSNGNFCLKLVFFHATQVPDGTIEAFLIRHYRIGVAAPYPGFRGISASQLALNNAGSGSGI